jgi:hypothetical protein
MPHRRRAASETVSAATAAINAWAAAADGLSSIADAVARRRREMP